MARREKGEGRKGARVARPRAQRWAWLSASWRHSRVDLVPASLGETRLRTIFWRPSPPVPASSLAGAGVGSEIASMKSYFHNRRDGWAVMQVIDEERLESDLQYRYEYLADFIGFGPQDVATIQAAGPLLGPLIPQLVDQTYQKLLRYTATARHFVPRQAGYDGPLPPSIEQISAQHPQIQFRKEHLARYFMQILTRSYDSKMVLYLDMVGKIHTPRAGSQEIDVPLVQMNALMGLLSDILGDALVSQCGDLATAWRTLRSFQKLLWLQNDFITRHYQSTLSLADA